MIAAIVAPVGIRNIAMMRACLVSGLAADLDGAGADRLRAAGLAVFRAVERVAASLADLAAYHPIWFLKQKFGPTAVPLDGFPRLLSWTERIAAIGHGRRSPTTSKKALDAARDATSIASVIPDPRDPIGRKPGQTVTVTPDDTGRDPVVGELVASGVHEIVIRRSDPAVGEVCVHFPRAGFVVMSA